MSKENNNVKRQTYYIEPWLISAIELMSLNENKNKSDIVNEALEKYIPQKYKDAIFTLKDK